jgi:CspA family cold shock protein
MITLDEVEAGAQCTHKNTSLRYLVVAVEGEEVLLEAQTDGHEPLTVPVDLFLKEFHIGERFTAARRRSGRGRGRRSPSGPPAAPTGPKSKGKIKKMVRDRGFGFIRGDDGKEVFFHRSGMNGTEYDNISEGDAVEYVIQEGPRGARAEHVRSIVSDTAVSVG